MIRYPGSKDKIVWQILRCFPSAVALGGLFSEPHLDYREPFFGAGAVGFRVFENLSSTNTVWINDLDYGVRCLWGTVHTAPHELIEKVRAFVPSVHAFDLYKQLDGERHHDPVETGFRKLALHQISFSGLGAKAGGPIGGRQQSSAYNVNCRWNPSRLCRQILEHHQMLRKFARVRITACDFAKVITDAPPHAVIYADPPYVEKGAELYKHTMSEQDHRRLAESLRASRSLWVLSYDDHPLVRELYDWAHIRSVTTTYTIATARTPQRRKNAELVITRE